MKNFNIELTESDVKALVLALTILPDIDLDLSPVQQSINDSLCEKCLVKIANSDPNFKSNEIRILYCSLAIMDEIIRGKWNIEPNLISDCRSFMFNVNKLLPKFEALLPDY